MWNGSSGSAGRPARPARRGWAAALAVLAGGWTMGPAAPAQEPAPTFSAGVELVEVYATVVDGAGELVTGLRQADFEVYEDERLQTITAFAAGEFPLTVALGVDRSWSMAGEPLRLAKRASEAFLRDLTPQDRSMVVAIGQHADIVAPLGMAREEQMRAIAALYAWSTTAFHDAIIESLDRLAPEPGRQALVVFSDGVDRYSEASAALVIERARRSHALVYAIGLGRTRPPLLAELAVVTGGRSFQLRDARELESTLAIIARELRHQYLIGYVPARPIERAGSEWRAIRVALRDPPRGVRVRARDGYVAD